jgi:nitroreductase
MLRDIVLQNRSCRRFFEYEKINDDLLRDLIDLARFCPSASNLQPLKFMILNSEEQSVKIYPLLGWAGYITEWDGPAEGERPPAYIVIMGDNLIKKGIDCDHGIVAQTILLGACEKGLGGCIIASIKRDKLREIFKIPDKYEILLVLAIGRPQEKIVLETVGPDQDIKYWRDENEVHHVPKRALEDIIVNF